MVDDKSKTGWQERNRVSASDPYEVGDFADKFNLSITGVHDLIKRFGNDRETLEREARKLRQ
ncbi:MAG TPA: DUF3606 domain-containing protein [Pseudaminobacter sp.]|nr:DUF3606 domain-containing protein [Pseudaminobacter sp.]